MKIFRLAALLAAFAVFVPAVSAQEEDAGAHTVTFDANGGDGTMDVQTFPIGMSQRLASNKFTFKGAKFLGWAAEKGANAVDYANGESIMITGDVTLYAVWDFKLISGGDSSFYMCDHEVTQKEYEQFCEYGGERFPSRFGMDDSFPVYFVSWYDALVYCNERSRAEGLTPVYSIGGSTDTADWGAVPKVTSAQWNSVVANPDADGFRLPTEEEWERAAGTTPKDAEEVVSGDGADASGTAKKKSKKKKSILDDYAWYRDNSRFKTHIVKEKLPNENGLYDMIGNVREWCWDRCDDEHPHKKDGNLAISTGEVEGSSRVFRGGCWNSPLEECATTEHGHLTPAARNFFVGFRVVRNAPGM